MSQARIPLRLSDTILRELYYGRNKNISEIQLASYQKNLEELIKKNIVPFIGKDYEALALVYFNQRKFDKFEALLLEVIKNHKYEPALLSLCIGKITLEEETGNFNIAPIVDFYFSQKEIVKQGSGLAFDRGSNRIHSTLDYKLKKIQESSLLIDEDKTVYIKHKSIEFSIDLEYLNSTTWDLPYLILQEIAIRITNETVSRSDIMILEEFYPDNIVSNVLARSAPIAI